MHFFQKAFLRQEWIFQARFLEDDNEMEASTSTPTDSEIPTHDDKNQGSSGNINTDNDSLLAEEEGVKRFGIIFLAAFVVILLFFGWRSFKYWKISRERYMMQVQSNRADAVLGDMQVCGWENGKL